MPTNINLMVNIQIYSNKSLLAVPNLLLETSTIVYLKKNSKTKRMLIKKALRNSLLRRKKYIELIYSQLHNILLRIH